MKVRFTPSARLQLLRQLAYVRQESPLAARKLLLKLRTTLRRLARFPRSGKPLAEFPDLPHREVVVAPYRVFYRVDGAGVWIVAIWHGAQVPVAP